MSAATAAKSRSFPHSPGAAAALDGSKRKRHESALMRMTAILAAVGAGFDIRLSNTVAIHPNLHTGEEDKVKLYIIVNPSLPGGPD